MEKKNCWEILKCGREIGGSKTNELGVCPAALHSTYDGVNKGLNGGRYCWTIAVTFCNGEISGTFAKKLKNCLECEFLQQVSKEEGRAFKLIPPKNTNNVNDKEYKYMEYSYRIYKEDKLLIKKYKGDWSAENAKNCMNRIITDPNWSEVDKVLTDMREIKIERKDISLEEYLPLKKEVNRKKYLHVHLVSDPSTTAFIHLMHNKLNDENTAYEYCTSIEGAIKLLNINTTKQALTDRIESLNTLPKK